MHKPNIVICNTLTGIRISVKSTTLDIDDILYVMQLVEFIGQAAGKGRFRSGKHTISYLSRSGLFADSWCSMKNDKLQDIQHGILSAIRKDPMLKLPEDVQCYIDLMCETILLEKQ